MPSIPVHLTDVQYTQMIQANRLYDRLDRARHYVRFRPPKGVGYKGHARDWWIYAIACVTHDIQKKFKNANIGFVCNRSAAIREYVEVYKRHLMNPTSLSVEERELLTRVEAELGFTELRALREIAMKSVEERTPQHNSPMHTFSTNTLLSMSSSSSYTVDDDQATVAPDSAGPSSLSSPVVSPTSQPASNAGESVLQRWFPSWTGWYAQTNESPEESSSPRIELEDSTNLDADDQRSIDVTASSLDDSSLSLYATPMASMSMTCDSGKATDNNYETLSPSSPACSHSDSGPSAAEASQKRKSRGRTISTSLEEEFLYVLSDSIENNTFTKRDAVFCQVSFTLKEGTFTLSCDSPTRQSSEIFRLTFSDVVIGLESRPRNKSYKFNIELGSLLLKDELTKESAFPYLIAPQCQGDTETCSQKSCPPLSVISRNLRRTISEEDTRQSIKIGNPQARSPLFSLAYEHCPFNSQTDHKLSIVTQPLDLVYNPASFDAASDFFLVPLQSGSSYHQHFPHSSNLSVAATKRYNAIMEQTKQELKKNWDQILQGGMRRQWTINLDISAPQIVFPEHFKDRNASLVVIDFGRLTFCSANSMSNKRQAEENSSVRDTKAKTGIWEGFMSRVWGQAPEMDDDDEEEFATPCSTPDELPGDDSFTASEELETQSNFGQPLTEELLQSHMYDKYEMQLCDMQVLVGKVRENWRFAYRKGTGKMHIIDRFSINVLLSRRVVSVVGTDRPWPTATLVATIPSIMLHLNQVKVHTLLHFVNIISDRYKRKLEDSKYSNSANLSAYKFENYEGGAIPKSDTISSFMDEIDDPQKKITEESLAANSAYTQTRYSQMKQDSTDSSALRDDYRLLVMQINVEKLSIELVSRGRSIAEVQVTGVKGNIQHRPCNYSASLTIHSFLLVDALQTFGPDFELLVASHKHISVDSVSGSLLDSDPCSPVSPSSPDHSSIPSQSLRPTSPMMLSKALHALAKSPGETSAPTTPRPSAFTQGIQRSVSVPAYPTSPPPGYGADFFDVDSEALICVEVTYVSNECPSQEGTGSMLLGSLQFNTIDIIANQETIVELVGFVHSLIPQATFASSTSSIPQATSTSSDNTTATHVYSSVPSSPAKFKDHNKDLDRQSMYGSLALLYNINNGSYTDQHPAFKPGDDIPLRVEMSFDFTKLSVLLLRGAVKDKEVVGRKVATAVLSLAKIQTTLADHQLSVEGSLGGFQIRDITPEQNKHQCVMSVGQDLLMEKQQDTLSRLSTEVYQSYAERESEASLKAFSFSVQRPLTFANIYGCDLNVPCESHNEQEKMTIKLELASVLYTHSPNFLREVSSCADEFKQYMTKLAQGLKHAATEVAMGLVSKRIESFAGLPGYSGSDSPFQRRGSLARSTDTLHLPHPPPVTVSHTSPTHCPPSDLFFRLKLNINLETPIIVLPESNSSSCVMVAQLGRITVKNNQESVGGSRVREDYAKVSNETQDIRHQSSEDDSLTRSAKYDVKIQDMSLYSLSVDDRKPVKGMPFKVRCAADLYRCGNDCSAIVHSTSIQLNVCHSRCPPLLHDSRAGMFFFSNDIYSNTDEEFYGPIATGPRDFLNVTGGVVSTVKLSVSRQQYHQLVQTLGNINLPKSAAGGTMDSRQQAAANLSCILEEEHHAPTPKKTLFRSASLAADHKSGSATSRKETESATALWGNASQNVSVEGDFCVPKVEVMLVGDVNGCSQPLVNLILEDFKATYENVQEHERTTKITLKSLVMEDLLCPSDSPHRYLLKSVDTPNKDEVDEKLTGSHSSNYSSTIPPPFISSSCPTSRMVFMENVSETQSLPSRLEIQKPFFKAQQRPTIDNSTKKRRKRFQQRGNAPSMTLPSLFGEMGSTIDESSNKNPNTPPPSPTQTNIGSIDSTTNLVKISVLSVSESSPEFETKYDRTHRFCDIAFNSLVAVVNIPSWVMILDFFSNKQRRESSMMHMSAENSMSSGLLDAVSIDNLVEKVGDASVSHVNESSAEINTVVEMSVVWLELGLVRVNGRGDSGVEVAGASVREVSVRSVGTEGNLTLNGRLGSLSVTDRTPHGHRYRHKFLTSGTEALTFQLFKYGSPDFNMLRDCDMRLKIKMASVIYIHTQRFATELIHVIQQFSQLQTIVEKWRAIRAGQNVYENMRGTRVSLSVCAGSPVIFLPLCGEVGSGDKMLVADLGLLEISNKFLWAGDKGTISKIEREGLEERLSAGSGKSTSRSRSRPARSRSRSLGRSRSRHSVSEGLSGRSEKPPKCLLDVMYVRLSNMDIYAAERKGCDERISMRAGLKKTIGKVAKDRSGKSSNIDIPGVKKDNRSSKTVVCDVEVTCDDDDVVWKFPDHFVLREGRPLLEEKCELTVQVERNLDTFVSRRVADISVHGCISKVHAQVNEETYKLIRGLLQYNLGEDLSKLHKQQSQLHHPHLPAYATIRSNPLDEDVYTTLSIVFDLDNVTVEAFVENSSPDNVASAEPLKPLACVNLIKSRLLYQSNSEGGKDVDLVSQEILMHDTRYQSCPVNKRPNVFTNILQPTPCNTAKNESLLQAELHYRSTAEVVRFTILLNNMRLFAVLDWWREVLSFIQLNFPNPYQNFSDALSVVTDATTCPNMSTPPLALSGGTTPPFTSTPPFSGISPRSASPTPFGLGGLYLPRKSSGLGRASPRLNPLVESTGVMSKYSLLDDAHDYSADRFEGLSSTTSFEAALDRVPPPFELKMNITDSEIVIVEDTAKPNSTALILKNTTVLSYRPSMTERPVSCNLSQCEVYSCILSAEQESALSILDPVTVNIEMTDRGTSQPDLATGALLSLHHVIEVSDICLQYFHTLYIC